MLSKILRSIVSSGNSKILLLIIVILIGVFVFKNIVKKEDKTIISHDVFVEKIEQMGKIELTKFTIKNVINKQIIKKWYPDTKILFIAVGEATGCIDLTKINKTDVKKQGDSVIITLPKPEICYIKLNHQKSKVYDISGVYFKEETKKLVEEVYQLGEKELENEAKELGIYKETEKNAQLVLKPIFENLIQKTVHLKFKTK